MKLKALLIALAVAAMGSTIHADSIMVDATNEENYIATETFTQWTPTSAIDVWTFSGPTAVFTLTNFFDNPHVLPGFLFGDLAKDHTTFISGSSKVVDGGLTLGLADFTGADFAVRACPVSSCVTGVVNVSSWELYPSEGCLFSAPNGTCEDNSPEGADVTRLGSFPTTEPTPEPGTLLLFGSGIGALGWMKRKALGARPRFSI
jgi:hypothetical protein